MPDRLLECSNRVIKDKASNGVAVSGPVRNSNRGDLTVPKFAKSTVREIRFLQEGFRQFRHAPSGCHGLQRGQLRLGVGARRNNLDVPDLSRPFADAAEDLPLDDQPTSDSTSNRDVEDWR